MTKRLLWRGALFALGVGMAVLIGSTPNSTALAGASVVQSAGQIAPPQPGLARVWIIRQFQPGETLRAPMVYINGTPVALAEPGTAFYRDLPPGTYRFTVDSCTRDTGQATDLSLTRAWTCRSRSNRWRASCRRIASRRPISTCARFH